MNIIGEVEGHTCILVDDIVDSGGTLCNAADALLEKGATDVYAYITHGVLSGGAVARIAGSKLKELVITDSIQPTEAVKVAPQYPGAVDRPADRRSDRPHRQRRIGIEPVRLTLLHQHRWRSLLRPRPACGERAARWCHAKGWVRGTIHSYGVC